MKQSGGHARILLHCLPPAYVHMPSPALNILKGFLNQNHFSAEIIYWNIKFEQLQMVWSDMFVDEQYEFGRLLPFLYSLAKQYDDKAIQGRIINVLLTTGKENKIDEKIRKPKYCRELLEKAHSGITDFIEDEFKSIDFTGVILSGFSHKFYQWVPALQIAEKIKASHSNIRTVIGGFDSKESAAEMLRCFSCFDFAVWGEGEYPLLELTKVLQEKKNDFKNICGLVYRQNGKIIISEKKDRLFLNLDEYPVTNQDDFFSVAKENKDKGQFLFYPVESIRGCDWNRCRFCVLGRGYKYRVRKVDSIIKEISSAIKKYNCGFFQFLDNNVIGSDPVRIDELLEKLTNFFINSYEDYCFFAEISPLGLTAPFYKKFALAGFRMVQIGGESFSDSLLLKMNKKNSFSDNLLAYKCCLKYGIRAEGANIITGIPGETPKEVYECIRNIPFLRFYTGSEKIKFDESPFVLEKLSGFYKELLPQEISQYNLQYIFNLLPATLALKMKSFELFAFKKSKKNNPILWNKFFNLLDILYATPTSYKIFRHGKLIIYEEFSFNAKTASLIFDKPEQFEILVIANHRLVSFMEMFETLQQKYRKITETSLRSMLKQLKSKYLIYYNENYDKIVTIIDTDQIL
jgi:radical SAM superfamily enzyme YgiQ (UPF0313 family)